MSEGITYGRRLTQLAQERGAATALIFAADDGTEQQFTYAEVDARANQVGRLLAAAGVGPDDLVAVGLRNSPEHVFTTFGAWKIGASVLPLRPELPEWERDRMLEVANAKAIVHDWADAPAGTVSLAEVIASTNLDAAPLPAERAPSYSRMVATSGSTGTPKIIVAPSPGHFVPEAIVSNGLVHSDYTVMAASPLYHTNGFMFCYPPLLAGNRVVLIEHFDAARAVDLFERYRVGMTVLVPTMLQRIARLPDVHSRDFSSIERIVYGGAVLPDWAARVWLELIPPERFMLTYGGSENFGLVGCTGAEWLTHPGTTGRPLNCDLLVLDPEHQPVPAGEIGEIWMRSHSAEEPFRYIGTSTPAPILDGYYTFGDLGRVDAEGYLYIADRRSDMIVSGGVNIFPAEVEAAISEHPGVADVVVLGLPDPEWGRRVYAVVEPRDPAAPPSEEELRTWAKARLAGPKVPKAFELVERMPRTTAGKINRSRLVEERSPSEAVPQ